MAVRIRMKKFGRRHRPYFRICVMDSRKPRDGRALEEVGAYDPLLPDADGRVTLNTERIDYWLGVGAQPSDKVRVLIKKYGTNGTHADKNKAAREKLAAERGRRRQIATAAASQASKVQAAPAPEESPEEAPE